METIEFLELDARQLLCPMPVIRLQNKIKTLKAICAEPRRAHIRVLCTDPGTLHDIPTWCRLYGHKILEVQEFELEIHFLVEVA